jgi:hypothetical protein
MLPYSSCSPTQLHVLSLSSLRYLLWSAFHHALSPLLYNFALKYAIMKVQENHVGLKLNGTHQLLFSAAGADLLGDNINTIKKNAALIDTNKEVASLPECRAKS